MHSGNLWIFTSLTDIISKKHSVIYKKKTKCTEILSFVVLSEAFIELVYKGGQTNYCDTNVHF